MKPRVQALSTRAYEKMVGIAMAKNGDNSGCLCAYSPIGSNEKCEGDLDYLIVLGAKVSESGPSEILRARLDAAYYYIETNPDTTNIVSGGKGSNEPFSEAEGMKRYLVEKGISAEQIILEPDTFKTQENIVNSMKLIKNVDAKVGIVTSDFHVYRAKAISKKLGLKNVSGISGEVLLF